MGIMIVDDIMGSGKSTWAIKYINDNPDKKFICVVPYLDEIKRYIAATNGRFVEPLHRGNGKYQNFKDLISAEKNIVTTHALILQMDAETICLLRELDYTLIIDEALSVLAPYKITQADLRILCQQKLIDVDDEGYVRWIGAKEYKGKFSDVYRLCELRSLRGFQDEEKNMVRLLMWSFPVEFFQCFKEVYIMTYLWEASVNHTFFLQHGIQYEKFMVEDKQRLIPYDPALAEERKKPYRNILTIHKGSLNEIGDDDGRKRSLTKNWYEKSSKTQEGKKLLRKLKLNTSNFFKNYMKTPSQLNMYSTFNEYKQFVSGNGYKRGFVACNCKGTNDFANKSSLAYLINLYLPPELCIYAEHYDIKINQDLYSLSALIQWIWRSRIRNKEPINLYIPSERMRRLLTEWLYGR